MGELSHNKKVVLDILHDEIRGDAASALRKLDPNYTMTWVYRGRNGQLFPRSGNNMRKDLEAVYLIRGRQYDVKHIAEGKDVVMVEMVESYPDPQTKRIFRTPLVLVLEMRKGKIAKGRHYCDPSLSHLCLSKKQVERAYH